MDEEEKDYETIKEIMRLRIKEADLEVELEEIRFQLEMLTGNLEKDAREQN